jgi:hypothetical protein
MKTKMKMKKQAHMKHLARPIHVRLHTLEDRATPARADRNGPDQPVWAVLRPVRDLERAACEPEVGPDPLLELRHRERSRQLGEPAQPPEFRECGRSRVDQRD